MKQGIQSIVPEIVDSKALLKTLLLTEILKYMKHHSTAWFWGLWISLAWVPVANPVMCPWLAIIPVFFWRGGGGKKSQTHLIHPWSIISYHLQKNLKNKHHQVILCNPFWDGENLTLPKVDFGVPLLLETPIYIMFFWKRTAAIPSGGLFFQRRNSLRSTQMVVKSKGIHPKIHPKICQV